METIPILGGINIIIILVLHSFDKRINFFKGDIKMKKINTLAAFIIFSFTHVYSQGLDTTNWFPYKTGNMWEYYVIEEFSVVDTFQIFNIKDSVDENSIIHLTQYSRYINPIQSFYEKFYIDTVNQFVYGNSFNLDSVLIYKLNAKQGEQWVMMAYHNGGGEMARVNSIYQGNLFGINTTFMDITYFGAADTTDTTGLERYSATLTKGFGLYFFGGFGALRNFLTGTIIDSILYGDTTQIVTSVNSDKHPKIPESLELLQNYPNPFNPYTIIRYEISKRTNINLKIINILGEELEVLVNEIKSAGNYEIEFNASHLSSGVYIAVLQTTEGQLTRSMLLIK